MTGSARLDVYRRGGDSLQGRYHHYRLDPFSLAEIAASGLGAVPRPGEELTIPSSRSDDTLAALMAYGGFPEPFLRQSPRTLRRWQKERLDRSRSAPDPLGVSGRPGGQARLRRGRRPVSAGRPFPGCARVSSVTRSLARAREGTPWGSTVRFSRRAWLDWTSTLASSTSSN